MQPQKLILVVLDGLTPGLLETALETDRTPTLARLAEQGTLRRAVSTFPSLTPVCLSSIATGAHPNVHHIPHLVWYDRGERRLVEYGSSFAAVRAAGFGRSLQDTILNMNRRHLSPDAVTVFEALEDAGLVTASVNFTCYRGRHRHPAVLPGVPAAYGPRRFFYYSLFQSDQTGAPLAVRNRAAGSIDAYAGSVGRWLVTRDGFDLLVFAFFGSHGLYCLDTAGTLVWKKDFGEMHSKHGHGEGSSPALHGDTLESVPERIRTHNESEVWKQGNFNDELIEAWVETLVSKVALAASFPDRRVGTGLYAFIEGKPNADEKAIHDFMVAKIGRDKAPERIQLVSALPRHADGSVRIEILQLIAMNQLDQVDMLIASESERRIVARIIADRRNLRDRFTF